LARRLHPRLTPLEKGGASGARVLPAAYEAYLKGRFFWNQRTEGSLAKSLDYFNRAIDLDPCYAVPLAGLADVYIVLGILGVRVPAEVFPRARAAAERALALDPYLPGVHESLATVLFHYDWQWREAEHEFQLALELNPNSTKAHQWYAGLLISTGRPSEAIAEAMRARDLDPLSPLQTTSMKSNSRTRPLADHAPPATVAPIRDALEGADADVNRQVSNDMSSCVQVNFLEGLPTDSMSSRFSCGRRTSTAVTLR
jgi:tetratricopeptide (TPR) repeat protein